MERSENPGSYQVGCPARSILRSFPRRHVRRGHTYSGSYARIRSCTRGLRHKAFLDTFRDRTIGSAATAMAQRTHTVFVSSTSEDLADFRDAVHEHLTHTGIFICTHQKTMGGRHAETMVFCRDHAANADFYIGLIGMRRGWEPDGDPQHRSITEIEYDSAKPDSRFVYITNERFPVPGNLRETDEEYRRQLEFRQRVKTRIVAQPDFSSPERLAAHIVRELLVHVQRRPHEADPLANLPDAVAERILRLLDERGDIRKAERGGLERDIVLKLAKRITPDDTLDFARAVTELDNAVNIALDVIARGTRGSNEDDFVN